MLVHPCRAIGPRPYRATLLAGAACIALLAGLWVYLVDRVGLPPSPAPFFNVPAGLQLLGPLGGWLPSLLHTFAFSLLTAAVLPATPSAAGGACVAWCAVNVAFEAGQHPLLAASLTRALHGAFGDSAPLRWTVGYFTRGTFDAGDMGAALLGALAAAAVLRGVDHRQEIDHAC